MSDSAGPTSDESGDAFPTHICPSCGWTGDREGIALHVADHLRAEAKRDVSGGGIPLPKLADDRRPERRRKVREIAGLLDSDLYKRVGGGEASAIWESPLKWVVEYGYDEAAEGYQPVWIEVRYEGRNPPKNPVHARTEDGDADWLNGAMP